MYKYKIIIYFIYYSLKSGIGPWKFFQVNAKYFNQKKGIFSKYEIESYIPEKWKLPSILISNCSQNTNNQEIEDQLGYPLFLKPEWGQNSHGIHLITNREELKKELKNISRHCIDYIAQKVSDYSHEYEILFIRKGSKIEDIEIVSIVESINEVKDKYCINSIHGKTSYHDILPTFEYSDTQKIKQHIYELKHFRIGRIGLKSNDIQSVIDGNFQIFEINIYIPFPLHLLDENISEKEKNIFLKDFVKKLVITTKNNEQKKSKSIFFPIMRKHYFIKLQHNTYYMKFKKILYAWIEKTFMNGCSDYNSVQVRRASRSKKQARTMFQKNNVPHAEGIVFLNPYTAYKFVKKHGFPIVLKPNVGGYSRGSFFPIENFTDFWKAMFFVKLWWPTSVVEKYLLGKNYRVVVTKQSVDIAMQRYPAFVIGDGKRTIGELIDEENKIRVSMDLLPTIHKIEKSSQIKRHIKKQGYNFDSILEKGKNLTLFHRVSIAPGGVLETVEVNTITEKNKKIFLDILDMFDANIFGIDVIMEQGIDVDYDKQKCIFLEVNSRPYIEMHKFPRYGKPADLQALHEKLSKIDIIGKGTY